MESTLISQVSQPSQPQTSIHWVTGVADIHSHSYDEYRELFMQELELTSLTYLGYGFNAYKECAVTALGVKLLFRPSREDMPEFCVVFPGEACEYYGLEKLKLLSSNLRLTRLDIAFDYFPLSPQQLKQTIIDGNFRSRAKRETLHDHNKHYKEHATTYFGSRQSTQFARCYNERGFNRFELVLQKERAEKNINVLLEASPQQAVSALRDLVDFVDCKANENLSRCPLLPWWDEYTQGVERAGIKLTPKAEPSLERLEQWLYKQVAASLATYTEVKGIQNLADILYTGLLTRTDWQDSLVAQTKQFDLKQWLTN